MGRGPRRSIPIRAVARCAAITSAVAPSSPSTGTRVGATTCPIRDRDRHWASTTYSIVPGDPLSARVTCRCAGEFGRDGLTTRAEIESMMEADAESFRIQTAAAGLRERRPGARAQLGLHDSPGSRMSVTAIPFWLDEPYEPRPPPRRPGEAEACVIGAGVGRAVVRAPPRRSRRRRGRARARDGRERRQRAQRRLPDRRRRAVLQRRPRALRARAGQPHLRRDAGGAGGDHTGWRAARRGRDRAESGPAAGERVRGGGRARPPRTLEMLAEDGFPAELVERGDLPPGVALRPQRGVHARTTPPSSPARWYRLLASAAERAGRAHLRGHARRGPRARAGRGAGCGLPAAPR